MQVLLVNPQQALPPGATEWLQTRGWTVTAVDNYDRALFEVRDRRVDAVIAPKPTRPVPAADGQPGPFDTLIRQLDAERVAVLLVGGETPADQPGQSLVQHLDRAISLPELRGRLDTIARYHALVRGLERELANLERIGKRLNEHFAEVDQEMRLASRLQRDFLPNLGHPIDGVQFAALYRPALWVSGDLYDVFRVDEDHVGFYIADAVGHGMAASLLTMFIKRTITPKRIFSDHYEIVPPGEVVAHLNSALAEQSLPNCQFVTAWYGLLNTKTLKLRYARGGHPHPLLFDRNGTGSEIKSSGSLLGLFPDEAFPAAEVQLQPGDKLVLFTDGVELAFESESGDELATCAYDRIFREMGKLSAPETIRRLEAMLDDSMGSISPRDDVTILALQVEPR